MNALSLGLVGTVLGVVWLLLALVGAALMVRLYLTTRASGFLWLLTALLIVPIVIRLVTMGVPIFAANRGLPGMDVAMIMVLTGGIGSLVSVALLIVAITLLQRQWPAFGGVSAVATAYPNVVSGYAPVSTAPVAAPYAGTDQPYGRSDS